MEAVAFLPCGCSIVRKGAETAAAYSSPWLQYRLWQPTPFE